jgi:hypothetical protein
MTVTSLLAWAGGMVVDVTVVDAMIALGADGVVGEIVVGEVEIRDALSWWRLVPTNAVAMPTATTMPTSSARRLRRDARVAWASGRILQP